MRVAKDVLPVLEQIQQQGPQLVVHAGARAELDPGCPLQIQGLREAAGLAQATIDYLSRSIMTYLYSRRIMKYLYYDLGEQQQDSWVVARLRGSAANVILLDRLNFDRYRFRRPFQYTGGLCAHTPARLQIPHDGQWYLVIDCGGYMHRVWVESIEILTPDDSPTASDADATLVGANA